MRGSLWIPLTNILQFCFRKESLCISCAPSKRLFWCCSWPHSMSGFPKLIVCNLESMIPNASNSFIPKSKYWWMQIRQPITSHIFPRYRSWRFSMKKIFNFPPSLFPVTFHENLLTHHTPLWCTKISVVAASSFVRGYLCCWCKCLPLLFNTPMLKCPQHCFSDDKLFSFCTLSLKILS